MGWARNGARSRDRVSRPKGGSRASTPTSGARSVSEWGMHSSRAQSSAAHVCRVGMAETDRGQAARRS
jgi:hypothetical protein